MRLTRPLDRPIIEPSTCDSIGVNIQGPSLIRMPDWAERRLGRYHLYFADHKGGHIRLAYADEVTGPWTVHRPGALRLIDSGFATERFEMTAEQIDEFEAIYHRHFGPGYARDEIIEDSTIPHIASPDVHVDHENRRFVMYFHGLERVGVQQTRVAFSDDGVSFAARPPILGSSYFRCFSYGGWWYALVMPGRIMRSADGLDGFEVGPRLFQPEMRHSAVAVRGDTLHVFWSRVGAAPESILHSTVDLSPDWLSWRHQGETVVLRPERPWEGSESPIEPSRRGAVHGLVNQLRDPCVFIDDDQSAWLLYAAGGESNIGLAELHW